MRCCILLLLIACSTNGQERIRHLQGDLGLEGLELRDSSGSFWGFDVATDRIWKWDGDGFFAYSFHHLTNYKYRTDKFLREDTLHRIWVYETATGQPEVFIFDQGTESFTAYPDMRHALETELDLHPELRFTDSEYPNPDLANGQAVFVRRYDPANIFHYDGKTWRSYPRADFTVPGSSMGDEHVRMGEDGTVYFVPYEQELNTGRIIRKECKLLPGATEWTISKTFFPLGGGIKITKPPPALKEFKYTQCRRDDEGDWWILKDQHLYRHAFGRTIRFTDAPLSFLADPREPDRKPNDLTSVQMDNCGNRLFTVYYPNRTFAALAGANPPSVAMVPIHSKPYECVVRLNASRPNCTFIWRIDRKPWSAPVEGPILRIADLPPERYQLEVLPLDDRLNRPRLPSEIQIVPGGSLDDLIATLRSDDYGIRNRSALILSRGGARTKQRLEERLAIADADLAWWISAILQRMEP